MSIDRTYQADKYHSLKKEFTRLKRNNLPLAVISQEPTGTGKGFEAVEMIKNASQNGKTSLFAVSGREIVKDFSNRLNDAGVPHETIMAGEHHFGLSNTNVCSIHTLQSWAFRNNRIEVPKADFVVFDEARLTCSNQFSKIVKHYVDAGSYVLGLDATPKAKGIGLVYESIVQGKSIPWHIANGSLSNVKNYAPSSNDIKLMKELLDAEKSDSSGEVKEKEQERILNKKIVIGDVYNNWKKIAVDENNKAKTTAIFNVNQQHAWDVYKFFKGKGEKAAYLDAETNSDDRNRIIESLINGELDVVMNISVLGYGVDIPKLEVVVANCVVRTVPRYLQMIGRVMRPYEDKECGIFIDHGGIIDSLGTVDQNWQWDLTDIDPSSLMIKQKKKNKEFKEITCFKCNHVFKGRRDCPSCGHQVISQHKQIPVYVYEATLEEVTKTQISNNKETKQQKLNFMAECKYYGVQKINNRQWNKSRLESFLKGIYKKKYGVWPRKEMINVNAKKTGVSVDRYIKGYWIYCSRRYRK